MRETETRPRAPEGRRVYAIGDIHGRADLLARLIAQIEQDSADVPAKAILVLLGDYIDRGADSRGVIDALLALSPDKFELVFLRGNHEAALLNFLANPATGPYWLRIGGDRALMSYGVTPFASDASPEALSAASQALAAALPPAHLEFLQSLKVSARYGDYVFVHAGLRPGKALEAQTDEDLISIRKDFLKSNARWPFVVVHGHSPVESGYRDERRIAVDTAAYATGKLSAVRLDGEGVTFIST